MTKELRTEITGGVLLILSLFCMLTFIPQATGVVGEFLIDYVLRPVFGQAMYLLPVWLLAIAVLFIFAGRIGKVGLRLTGLIIFFSSLCALVEIFAAPGGVTFMSPLAGGGWGNLIALALQSTFSTLGAFFFLLVFILIAMLLIANYTLKDFLLAVKNLFMPPRSGLLKIKTKDKEDNRKLLQKQRHKMYANPVNVPQPVAPPSAPRQATTPLPDARRPSSTMTPQDKNRLKELREKLLAKRRAPVAAVPVLEKTTYSPQRSGNYKCPPLNLLRPPVEQKDNRRRQELQFAQESQLLESTLASFNVKARVTNVCPGPTVTRYELTPAPGVRVNRIANLADDISLSMSSTVRIEAPVPDKPVVGVEIPNRHPRPVNLSELAAVLEFKRYPLQVALGLDIAGNPVFCNLQQMPHLLIAGATGAGKSVCINSLIMSILLKAGPQDVRFAMIDPKRVELSNYNNIPHLVAPVVHEPQLAYILLKFWAIKEMEKRYEIFTRAGVKNIEDFNRLAERQSGRTIQITQEGANGVLEQVPYRIEHMPYVVIIIDELADLMMVGSKDVEASIVRLTQLARATGIHLVIATQRPSVDVITGLIKANVPSRVAFAVGSQIDSRTIIDGMGAEKLLGKGDMLYSPVGARYMRRVQGVYISDEEIRRVVQYIKMESGAPQYELDLNNLRKQAETSQDNAKTSAAQNNGSSPNVRSDGRDVLFDQAAQLVQSTGKKSISYIQRKFRIGYNRAARIVEELEEAGMLTI